MIKLIDVVKSFGPKLVLNGFTLEVLEGETMVIIGYSGTGKSVAIKHIVGLLEPDAGTVVVDGLEVPRLPRRELYRLRARIGYVFQFAALFDSMTVGENVAMGLRKQNELDEREIAERVNEALDLVDLPDAGPRPGDERRHRRADGPHAQEARRHRRRHHARHAQRLHGRDADRDALRR